MKFKYIVAFTVLGLAFLNVLWAVAYVVGVATVGFVLGVAVYCVAFWWSLDRVAEFFKEREHRKHVREYPRDPA